MLVLHYTALGLGIVHAHMQGLVSMVVVVQALTMHCDVCELARPLLHARRSERTQRLPQKHHDENECLDSSRHERILRVYQAVGARLEQP